MNGEFDPVYSTNNIWRDDDMEQCLTLDLEDIETDIAALQSGKASTTHTHAISDITNLSTNLEAKYIKPSTGIPKTDLASDVQSSLGKADTALQSYTETDPTVPTWAKATSKPSYTATEVGALPSTTTLADLTGDATHRTVTDAEKTAWNAKSTFSGSYNDLTDKPTIPSIDGLATTSYVDEKNTAQDTVIASKADLGSNGKLLSTQLPEIATATETSNGLMGSADKTKLNSYAPQAILISSSAGTLPTVVNGAILIVYNAGTT